MARAVIVDVSSVVSLGRYLHRQGLSLHMGRRPLNPLHPGRKVWVATLKRSEFSYVEGCGLSVIEAIRVAIEKWEK